MVYIIKIGVIAIVAIIFLYIFIAILKKKSDFVDNSKKKRKVDVQPSLALSEKELPTKFTKKQLKRVEKYEEKVDDLEKKNSELDKKVKELTNQIEILRKDIRAIQEKNTNSSPNASGNPSPISNNVATKEKTNGQNEHPIVISYERLTIGGDGNLIHCEEGHQVYYKAWKEGERIKFEFVNNDRTKKAINNRSTYIEPFCNKIEDSKLPDESNYIDTITPGILNNDYSVKEKAVIRYK